MRVSKAPKLGSTERLAAPATLSQSDAGGTERLVEVLLSPGAK
jgi:hypothetical protein